MSDFADGEPGRSGDLVRHRWTWTGIVVVAQGTDSRAVRRERTHPASCDHEARVGAKVEGVDGSVTARVVR
jgi:hypothetical protein